MTIALANSALGTVIRFKNDYYTVLKHNRANTQIKHEDGSVFNLNGRAMVEVVSVPSLEEQIEIRYPTPTVRVGDPVRLPAGRRFGGIVGIVCKLTMDKIHIVQVGQTGVLSISVHENLETLTVEEYAGHILNAAGV